MRRRNDRSPVSPQTRLWWEAMERPPTTAEWLSWLRRVGDKTRFYRCRKGRWSMHRRLRPFICPRTAPLECYTTGGYWWVRLPDRSRPAGNAERG